MIMNENFINIKVDREERPDVDQVYMNAVQLMTGGGGWPLNCITLPAGNIALVIWSAAICAVSIEPARISVPESSVCPVKVISPVYS